MQALQIVFCKHSNDKILHCIRCICTSARARGDPHLVTLDGHKYTFNGKGEFTLVEILDNHFTLQARMVDIINENGTAGWTCELVMQLK